MNSQPISVIVDRKVCPGNKQEFELLLEGVIYASSLFKGYLGTQVIKPKTEDDHNYQVLFRFDSQENLDKWSHSKERLSYIEKIDQLIEKPSALQVITGLESWFALPGQKTLTPPPRHKMAVVTWLSITPLLIAFNYLIGPFLKDLPLVLRVCATTPCIVLIMTYLWMPFMTKLFKSWLYPSDPTNLAKMAKH